MPRRFLRADVPDDPQLHSALQELRQQLRIPGDFPSEVLAEADRAAKAPRLPDADETGVEFVTLDPLGARDLDQALHIAKSGTGYVLKYAIADVGAFVRPGGAIDAEAHRRGETYYAPDGNVLLHPPVLAHGAASLLPDEVRPALVWTIDLDADGDATSHDVRRALVRSRAQLDYETAQRQFDAGDVPTGLELLSELGVLRLDRERDHDAVTLDVPEQVVSKREGGYDLSFRAPLAVEHWNAQLSLLTGIAAAQLMLYAEVGVLRTLPDPQPWAVARLRRTAKGLRVDWPSEETPEDFVRRLDARIPAQAAVLVSAATLLQGAGYMAFDGGVPAHATHAGIGAEYAHATAPLRRLVDRYVGEVCVAICADTDVPEWARAALPKLPKEMEEASQRSHQYDGGITSVFEAAALQSRIGDVFDGVIVEVDRGGESGTVQLCEPAVAARIDGDIKLGSTVRARVVEADMQRRLVRFQLVS